MMWTLRAALPKRSPWRRAQFDTLRLRLVKSAARVVELKTRIAIHLPSACPAAPLMRLALERLPRMTPIRCAPRQMSPPDNRNPRTTPRLALPTRSAPIARRAERRRPAETAPSSRPHPSGA